MLILERPNDDAAGNGPERHLPRMWTDGERVPDGEGMALNRSVPMAVDAERCDGCTSVDLGENGADRDDAEAVVRRPDQQRDGMFFLYCFFSLVRSDAAARRPVVVAAAAAASSNDRAVQDPVVHLQGEACRRLASMACLCERVADAAAPVPFDFGNGTSSSTAQPPAPPPSSHHPATLMGGATAPGPFAFAADTSTAASRLPPHSARLDHKEKSPVLRWRLLLSFPSPTTFIRRIP
jgi:hypothetical protein